MNNPVVDASALLAFLRNEPGASVVAKNMEYGAYISAANWVEVLSKICDLGVDSPEMVKTLKGQGILGQTLLIAPLIEEDANIIAQLRPLTKKKGLSLGDQACLALAMRLKTRVITTDNHWRDLDLAEPEIEIVR